MSFSASPSMRGLIGSRPIAFVMKQFILNFLSAFPKIFKEFFKNIKKTLETINSLVMSGVEN